MNSRDKGCRFPGCSFTRYVDGHRVRHWADGGATKLSNLVMLCRFHHRLVHEGQVAIQTLDDGAFRFIRPNGESFDSPVPPPSDGRPIIVAHESERLALNASTAVTRWTGEALDLDVAVGWLMKARQPEQGSSIP